MSYHTVDEFPRIFFLLLFLFSSFFILGRGQCWVGGTLGVLIFIIFFIIIFYYILGFKFRYGGVCVYEMEK